MKLIEMKVETYLEELASKSPAPGGGSVSAVSGAQGIGLAIMVMRLTLGKEKYADSQQLCEEKIAEASMLLEAFENAIDEDTQAYNKVSEAFRMPKSSDEEKAKRSLEIRKATLEATEVPFKIMKLAAKSILLLKEINGKVNNNAASDLGVAADTLWAAFRGAWLNVKINLPGLKDESKEKYFKEEANKLFEHTAETTSSIYCEIEERI